VPTPYTRGLGNVILCTAGMQVGGGGKRGREYYIIYVEIRFSLLFSPTAGAAYIHPARTYMYRYTHIMYSVLIATVCTQIYNNI